jgi:hypothetical protein
MALVKAGADVHCTDEEGYGSSGHILALLVRRSAGLDGPSTRGGAEGAAGLAVQVDDAALGVGGRQRQRRVRFSGCVLVSLVCQCGLELQEWLLRLCRKKALHWASQNGHTERATALVEAGADVHCNGTERVRVLGLFRGFRECAPQWREG